jgi:hypothetical protein
MRLLSEEEPSFPCLLLLSGHRLAQYYLLSLRYCKMTLIIPLLLATAVLATPAKRDDAPNPLPSYNGNGMATFYSVVDPNQNQGYSGAVACNSDTYDDSGSYVALGDADGGGTWACGMEITITDPSTGNTVTAPAVDSCTNCDAGHIDLSVALWDQLHNGNQDDGEIHGLTWSFAGSSSSGGDSSSGTKTQETPSDDPKANNPTTTGDTNTGDTNTGDTSTDNPTKTGAATKTGATKTGATKTGDSKTSGHSHSSQNAGSSNSTTPETSQTETTQVTQKTHSTNSFNKEDNGGSSEIQDTPASTVDDSEPTTSGNTDGGHNNGGKGNCRGRRRRRRNAKRATNPRD